MADVGATLVSWSSTTASNSPSGATSIGTGLDDNLREIQGVITRGLSHKGADIASATTTDIGAVEGLMHDITGTTTITGLGTVRAGILKILKFEGALTLTHNATSLILPGGANVTTADGDVGIFLSEGSGNWRALAYQKATGLGVVGGVVQRAYTEYLTNTDLTTAIPGDDSIPQNTEGTEIMTQAITPKSASNRIRIRFQGQVAHSSDASAITAALFVDSTADALSASITWAPGAGIGCSLVLEYEVSAASTSARTYKVRVGPPSGTARMNGTTSSRLFGGVSRSTLIVEEIC
jgi:hypothetical protein